MDVKRFRGIVENQRKKENEMEMGSGDVLVLCGLGMIG